MYAQAQMSEVYGRYTHRTNNPDLGFTDHDVWVDALDYGAYFGDALVHYAQMCPSSEVAEDWRPFEPPAHGPGRVIKACRLFPKQDVAWNYALPIDDKDPAQSLLLKRDVEGGPEHPRAPGFPFSPMQLSDKVETVRLVPFGCTRLRMTYLSVLPS